MHTKLEPQLDEQVSIIIVNYNAGLRLLCCLDSIKFAAPRSEVIVVDNASKDDSVQTVKKNYPSTIVYERPKNTGFGSGVNYGVSQASKKYIFILNPDTILKKETITKLVTDYESIGRSVILGMKHVFPDGTAQNAGRSFPGYSNAFFNKTSLLTKLFPNNRFSKKYLSPSANVTGPLKNVDWVSGATMFMEKATFEKLNGFDCEYFLYCEDVDFCKRAENQGIDRIYDTNVEVIHSVGVSGKSAPFDVIKHRHQSIWTYYKKHFQRSIPMDFVTLAGITARASWCYSEEIVKVASHSPQKLKDLMREKLKRVLLKDNVKKTNAKEHVFKNVLFLRTDHLGDVLLSLPAIQKFKKSFPHAHITLMGQPQWKDLVLATNIVDDYLLAAESDFFRLKGMYTGKFDLVIELGQRETLRNAILGWLSRIPNRVGYHTSYTGLFYTKILRWDYRFRPEIEMTGRLLKEVGIDGEPEILNLSETLNLEINLPVALKGHFIVVHPFAVSSFRLKEWPYERFVELANRLHQEGSTVVLVGTAGEAKEFSKAAFKLNPGIVNLIGKTSLLQLAKLIEQCAFVIANNSGVYQLAMAFQKKCVLINGPSNLKRWGPLQDNVTVVQVEGLACAGRDCGTCMRGDHACMDLIEVQTVYQASKKLIAHSL